MGRESYWLRFQHVVPYAEANAAAAGPPQPPCEHYSNALAVRSALFASTSYGMFETGVQFIYVIMGFGDVSFDNANKGVVLGNSYYSSLWCVEISIDWPLRESSAGDTAQASDIQGAHSGSFVAVQHPTEWLR